MTPDPKATPVTTDELTRFGIRWNGPHMAISVPMADGYWTPWHLARAILDQQRQKIATLEARIKELESRIVYAAGELVGPTKPYLSELKKERDAIVERQRSESK